MKNLFLSLLLLFSMSSFAGIQIVSDLDDTIKITNSDDFWPSLGYGLARRKVFIGMPEFLAGTRTYVSRVSLVSSSPRIIKWNIKKLLRKHEIQVENIILNGNLHRQDHIAFKTAAIKKLIDGTEDLFIFLGDDVGDDPEIYDQLMKDYPGRVLAIYIHVVNNRPVPATSQTFFTAYELAVKENLAGRLAKENVRTVAKEMLSYPNYESIFPEFAACPKEASYYAWLNDTDFKDEALPLTSKLVTFCQNGQEND